MNYRITGLYGILVLQFTSIINILHYFLNTMRVNKIYIIIANYDPITDCMIGSRIILFRKLKNLMLKWSVLQYL